MFRMLATLIILIAMNNFLPVYALDSSDSQEKESPLLGGPFRLEIRAGYTGTMWTPKGLEPYVVNNYGRELFYGELAVLHPLLTLGEAFDIVQIPRLRIETNFGYTRTESAFEEAIPRSLRDNAYLRTTGWFTFWEWFSFRYREERYDVSVSRPSDWVYDEFTGEGSFPSIHNVENRMTDLEMGIIGSPDGRVHETMIEIGYYHSAVLWPMVIQDINPEFGSSIFLTQKEIAVQGIYFALNTQPNPELWPMDTQFMVRIGGALGLDARFQYEHEMLKRWFLGLELDASYRVINNYTDENDEQFIIKDNNPRDVRYRLTLYSLFVLL
jgi:hypothetical protein